MNLMEFDLPYGNIPASNKYKHTAPAFGVFQIKKLIPFVATIPEGRKSNLYPNPVVDQVFIDFLMTSTETAEIGIYDLTGRLVKKENVETDTGVNSYSYDISFLNSGLYMISISSQKTKRITEKFQKK
jgi:hypothetical protein